MSIKKIITLVNSATKTHLHDNILPFSDWSIQIQTHLNSGARAVFSSQPSDHKSVGLNFLCVQYHTQCMCACVLIKFVCHSSCDPKTRDQDILIETIERQSIASVAAHLQGTCLFYVSSDLIFTRQQNAVDGILSGWYQQRFRRFT